MLSSLSPFLLLCLVFLVQWNERIDLVARNIAMIFCHCQISEDLLNYVVCMTLWEKYHPVVGNLKAWVKINEIASFPVFRNILPIFSMDRCR